MKQKTLILLVWIFSRAEKQMDDRQASEYADEKPSARRRRWC